MAAAKHDPVHHPSHYTSGKVECIEAIEAALGPEGFIAFLRGQVIKYTWRLGKKDAPAQEAGKAKWYQDLLVRKLEEQEQSQSQQEQEQPPSIQGEALTDNTQVKEISNGTIINGLTYGSLDYPLQHTGRDCIYSSSTFPGWWCTVLQHSAQR